MEKYKAAQKKAIILKLGKGQAGKLLDTLFQCGFELHHAEKSHIVLTKWLRDQSAGNLPSYATHLVGCGGTVINDNNEILLVQEKSGPRQGY